MSHTVHRSLRQIPAEQCAYNRDRSRALGWYVARHDEDRYDDTTEYRIGLFDIATQEELTFFVTSVHERADLGTRTSSHLVSAAFDSADEDTVILCFADGSETRRSIDEAFNVPDSDGAVVSEAEKRVRERLRERAEKIKRG